MRRYARQAMRDRVLWQPSGFITDPALLRL